MTSIPFGDCNFSIFMSIVVHQCFAFYCHYYFSNVNINLFKLFFYIFVQTKDRNAYNKNNVFLRTTTKYKKSDCALDSPRKRSIIYLLPSSPQSSVTTC